jgi:RimJ/RimL family protein N-acetyltransferase
MEADDMELYREMANDPETERLLGGWSFPIAPCEQEAWYQKAVTDKKNLRFTVVARETGEAVGMVNLVDLDWKNGSAFQGIRLAASGRGKGYGMDAVMSLMRYAFEELRLHRLNSSIIQYNFRSQKMYERCGWKIEGKKEQAVFRNGRYWDLLITGILRADYERAKIELGYGGAEQV